MSLNSHNYYSGVAQTSHYNGATQFIQSLWSSGYKRLMVVRVDLLLREEYQRTTTVFDMKEYRSHLWSNRRSKPSIFKHCLGWIWGMEYTEQCGYHCHCLFVFDADHVQADVYYGNQIGEYWKNVITQGKGAYYNCNRYQDQYTNNGIGRVHVNDQEKCFNLLHRVIPYLAKGDNAIRAAMSQDEAATGRSASGIRTFGYTP